MSDIEEGEDGKLAAAGAPFGLLPCPFCGDAARFAKTPSAGGTHDWWHVECVGGNDVDCAAQSQGFGLKVQAAQAWNRRAAKEASGEKAGITQAARSDARTPPLSPWRDISSAPKDGTDFLAYWDRSKCHSIVLWSVSDNFWMEEFDRSMVSPPTHWQPLSSPPAGDAIPPSGRKT
jgi:hypothetical protein